MRDGSGIRVFRAGYLLTAILALFASFGALVPYFEGRGILPPCVPVGLWSLAAAFLTQIDKKSLSREKSVQTLVNATSIAYLLVVVFSLAYGLYTRVDPEKAGLFFFYPDESAHQVFIGFFALVWGSSLVLQMATVSVLAAKTTHLSFKIGAPIALFLGLIALLMVIAVGFSEMALTFISNLFTLFLMYDTFSVWISPEVLLAFWTILYFFPAITYTCLALAPISLEREQQNQ